MLTVTESPENAGTVTALKSRAMHAPTAVPENSPPTLAELTRPLGAKVTVACPVPEGPPIVRQLSAREAASPKLAAAASRLNSGSFELLFGAAESSARARRSAMAASGVVGSALEGSEGAGVGGLAAVLLALLLLSLSLSVESALAVRRGLGLGALSSWRARAGALGFGAEGAFSTDATELAVVAVASGSGASLGVGAGAGTGAGGGGGGVAATGGGGGGGAERWPKYR